jgi:hypothetical protein
MRGAKMDKKHSYYLLCIRSTCKREAKICGNKLKWSPSSFSLLKTINDTFLNLRVRNLRAEKKIIAHMVATNK